MRTTLIGLALLGVAWGSYAEAQTFADCTSGYADKRFDPAASVFGEGYVDVGFHTNHNAYTGFNEFRAGQADLGTGPAYAQDTLSCTVTAPDGRELDKLYVDLGGSYSISRLGRVGGGAMVTVDGSVHPVGEFVAGAIGNQRAWSLDGEVDVAGKTEVRFSLTASVFGWTVPTSGSVTIRLDSAVVSVSLAPLPEPEGVEDVVAEVTEAVE